MYQLPPSVSVKWTKVKQWYGFEYKGIINKNEKKISSNLQKLLFPSAKGYRLVKQNLDPSMSDQMEILSCQKHP